MSAKMFKADMVYQTIPCCGDEIISGSNSFWCLFDVSLAHYVSFHLVCFLRNKNQCVKTSTSWSIMGVYELDCFLAGHSYFLESPVNTWQPHGDDKTPGSDWAWPTNRLAHNSTVKPKQDIFTHLCYRLPELCFLLSLFSSLCAKLS